MVYYSQSYEKPHESYYVMEKKKKRDFTNLIPVKRTEFLPIEGGVLGYTYRNLDYMVIKYDLV